MSVRTRSGLKHEPEVLPSERDAFIAEIFDQWAAGDEHKLRRLAVGYLRSSGWKIEMIAKVLRVDKSVVSRMVDQLAQEFSAAFSPPDPPP